MEIQQGQQQNYFDQKINPVQGYENIYPLQSSYYQLQKQEQQQILSKQKSKQKYIRNQFQNDYSQEILSGDNSIVQDQQQNPLNELNNLNNNQNQNPIQNQNHNPNPNQNQNQNQNRNIQQNAFRIRINNHQFQLVNDCINSLPPCKNICQFIYFCYILYIIIFSKGDEKIFPQQVQAFVYAWLFYFIFLKIIRYKINNQNQNKTKEFNFLLFVWANILFMSNFQIDISVKLYILINFDLYLVFLIGILTTFVALIGVMVCCCCGCCLWYLDRKNKIKIKNKRDDFFLSLQPYKNNLALGEQQLPQNKQKINNFDQQNNNKTDEDNKSKETIQNDQNVCSICLKGNHRTPLPCKHTFHYDCIKLWLSDRNTCPICRKNIY